MLDLLTNAPKGVQFGKRQLLVGPLKLRELGLLQRWIRDHSEKPTAALEKVLAFIPEEDQRDAKKAAVLAERDWPPAVGTAEGNAVLFGDPDGQYHFLAVLLRKYQPELHDDFLNEVAAGLSHEDFGVLVQIAFGEDDFDPEALREAAKARIQAVQAAILNAIAPPEETTGESSSQTTG